MCNVNNLMLLERPVQNLAVYVQPLFFSDMHNVQTYFLDSSRELDQDSRRNVADRHSCHSDPNVPASRDSHQELCPNAHPKLDEVRHQLPFLFAPDYPQVLHLLHHAELREMNIHVHPNSGAITGVVKWRDATIGSCGLSLWDLETLLGALGSYGWHFHACHLDLRNTFWHTNYTTAGIVTDAQKEAVKVGRLFGIFQAYTPRKDVLVEAGDASLSILEKVLSVGDS